MIWGKAIGLLEKEMGGVRVCDNICQEVGWTSSLLSCDEPIFSG